MHLIRSHGLMHLEFLLQMVFASPSPFFASSISSGVAEALAGEDQGKQVIEPLSCGLP